MTPEDAPAGSKKIPESSLLQGLSAGAARGLALGTVIALPTIVRCGMADVSLVDGVLAAFAVSLAVALPVAMLAPRAARGFRGVVGPSMPRRLGLGLVVWIGLSSVFLLALGALLKATTHHRGLGGATFGVFGAAAVAAAAVVAVRLGQVNGDRRGKMLLSGAAALAATLAGGGLLWPLIGGEAHPARAALFDVAWLGVATALILPRELPSALLRPARLLALPLSLSLLAAGWYRVETSPGTRAVQEVGGGPATVLWALERWTDRDADGMGAHFGGGDCDEGDPTRHPGAGEIEGDGVDSNCDGVEAPVILAATNPEPSPIPAAPPPQPASTPSVDPATSGVPKKPDIVLVTLDTTAAKHTSLHGYARKTTPTLEALGERGLVFEHAYAIGSDTQRALMPLVSCRVLSRTQKTNIEWPRLLPEEKTLAEQLRGAGYATGAVTSFTWLRRDRGFDQGFDQWDQSPWKDNHPEREVTGAAAVDAALKMYDQLAKGDAPVFLWVHLFDPHTNYVAHEGIDYGEGDVDLYDGEIQYMDQQLARLVKKVDGGARADKTVWLVHGSHGEAFGEHDKMEHGSDVYDEMTHVPWLAVGPGIAPRRVKDGAVSTLDVAPTMLDLAGVSQSACDGVSLAGVLQGGPLKRGPVLSFADARTAVIDWPLKLRVLRRKDKSDRLILFDLSEDPGETKDLSADRSEDLTRLSEIRKGAFDDS